jgi:DNA-binding transcriptional LysR family regulator
MDRLSAMRIFAAVADAGSLSAAGRRLGVPLATVSRQLSALEDHAGARLVTRTTRHLTLTEPGRNYLESCRRILEEVEAADRRLAGEHGEPRGLLALTAPVAFGRHHVLPIVTDFLRKHPRVDVRMLLLDRSVDLIEEGLDVAVRIGELADSSLVAARVGSVRAILCASPGYLKAKGKPRTPDDLAMHDCITVPVIASDNRWVLGPSRRPRRVRVHSRLVANSAEAVVDAAAAGLGIARILSYQAERAIAAGKLVRVLADYEGEDVPVSVLHREARLPQLKVQDFVAFAVERLRKRLRPRQP